MENNRGMDRGIYEMERRMLLQSLRDIRSGKVRADRAAMYLENTRKVMAGIRAQRYAKPGTRAYRNRHR